MMLELRSEVWWREGKEFEDERATGAQSRASPFPIHIISASRLDFGHST